MVGFIAVIIKRVRQQVRWRAQGRRYHRGVSLDPLWLFLSLFPSGLGFVLFVYGRKQQRWSLAAFGIAFMAYPYFTPTIPAMIGIGLALGAAAWVVIRGGW
jgi:hypothetical protein